MEGEGVPGGVGNFYFLVDNEEVMEYILGGKLHDIGRRPYAFQFEV